MWNLVSHVQGRTYAGGVREEGAEEGTVVWEGRGNRGMEKITLQGVLGVLLTKYYFGDQINKN